MKRQTWIHTSIALLLSTILFAYISCNSGVYDNLTITQPILDSLSNPPQEPWIWIRENTKTHYTSEQGLSIELEPGSLMGGGQGVKNILVRPLPINASMVEAQVEFDPELQYEQAGLILYNDDDSYIKLVKEFVDGKPWIVMGVEIDAKNPMVKKVPVSGSKVKLRFRFNEESIQGIWVDHDNTETIAGAYDFPMKPRPCIGLFTQNAHPPNQCRAAFSDFRIE